MRKLFAVVNEKGDIMFDELAGQKDYELPLAIYEDRQIAEDMCEGIDTMKVVEYELKEK